LLSISWSSRKLDLNRQRLARQVSMSEQHPYRAKISPVSEGTPRPLWSVMIPTYNCASYLRKTLASVLAQDPGPDMMQIEVVDDYSTQDDPAAVVEELGGGRVSFYRQAQNVGHTRNLETCLQRSWGYLIHLLHGDDYVLDGFYRKLQMAFEQYPEIGAAFCRHIYVDEHGHWQDFSGLERHESGILTDWLERIAVRQRVQTPSIAVRREVYEKLGGFDRRLSWAEDWEMWVWIAVHYPFWYEVQPLAAYRIHSASNSGRYIRTGENIRDVRRAIQMIRPYLPVTAADRISKQSREHWALYALTLAHQMLASGDVDGARAQMREAIKCRRSFKVVVSVLPLLLGVGKQYTQQIIGVGLSAYR
jgi:glycosyltransferase involved in cell wall biosynthesis